LIEALRRAGRGPEAARRARNHFRHCGYEGVPEDIDKDEDYELDSDIDNELFDGSIRVNDLVYY